MVGEITGSMLMQIWVHFLRIFGKIGKAVGWPKLIKCLSLNVTTERGVGCKAGVQEMM